MTGSFDQRIFEFTGYRMNLARRTLVGPDGASVKLKPRVFDTLAVLAARPGELVTRRELMGAVWPNLAVEENNLSQAIVSLRRALAAGTEGMNFIATVPGRGYQFVAPVLSAVARTPIESIAVLPFVNLSSDPEQEYFSHGLAEELQNQLSQLPQLRVIGRSSALACKGRREDLRAMGEMLGVSHCLEGSVRKAGNRVRISTQLVSVTDSSNVWSQTFERSLDDVFAVQDEVSKMVAAQLQVESSTFDGKPCVSPTPAPSARLPSRWSR